MVVPIVSCVSGDTFVSSLWDTAYMPDFPGCSQAGEVKLDQLD